LRLENALNFILAHKSTTTNL